MAHRARTEGRTSAGRGKRQFLDRGLGARLGQQPAQICKRGSQVAAVDDHVDHAVVSQIFGSLKTVGQLLAGAHHAVGDAWYRAGEFGKASAAYTDARPLVAANALADAELLIKLSRVEAKLGKYAEALLWTEQARDVFERLSGQEAEREAARSTAWYATLLIFEGRTTEALEWTQRAVSAAEAAGDPEATGEAYFATGACSARRAPERLCSVRWKRSSDRATW